MLQRSETGPKNAEDYRAFVGPEDGYDRMSAMQFNLLTFLGLREDHYPLYIGCGSLRAGRLFIPYLKPGRYFGIEPQEAARGGDRQGSRPLADRGQAPVLQLERGIPAQRVRPAIRFHHRPIDLLAHRGMADQEMPRRGEEGDEAGRHARRFLLRGPRELFRRPLGRRRDLYAQADDGARGGGGTPLRAARLAAHRSSDLDPVHSPGSSTRGAGADLDGSNLAARGAFGRSETPTRPGVQPSLDQARNQASLLQNLSGI